MIFFREYKTIIVIQLVPLEKIEMKPIGFVQRTSSKENDKDRSLISKVVFNQTLVTALEGIEEFSHLFILFWMHNISNVDKKLVLPGLQSLGIFATRAPIRPNPIGLTLVELLKREENVIWVRGLDAFNGTPVLDIKPYPDWERGRWVIVTQFRSPKWLTNMIK
jgi:tRNA-Thr(GGU) m(6)t(6)A37 methyltransferase TsaA